MYIQWRYEMTAMNFRCTAEQKSAIEAKAASFGFGSVGAYIKFVAINADVSITLPHSKAEPKIAESLIVGFKKAYDEFIEEPTEMNAQKFEIVKRSIIDIDTDDTKIDGIFGIITLYLTARNTDNIQKKAKNYKSVRKAVFEMLELLKML